MSTHTTIIYLITNINTIIEQQSCVINKNWQAGMGYGI